jgi:hypothetical protein
MDCASAMCWTLAPDQFVLQRSLQWSWRLVIRSVYLHPCWRYIAVFYKQCCFSIIHVNFAICYVSILFRKVRLCLLLDDFCCLFFEHVSDEMFYIPRRYCDVALSTYSLKNMMLSFCIILGSCSCSVCCVNIFGIILEAGDV